MSADLFPTKMSFFIFIAYIMLFVNQGLLVTASKSVTNRYNYNPTIVILVTECLKLISSVILYLKDNDIATFGRDIVKHKQAILLYFVPAGLYCLYNNLSYVNLQAYDPTTYFLLLQFRVVLTGVVFQILFSKKLSQLQWCSLILLTFGCILKEVHQSEIKSVSVTPHPNESSFGMFNIHFVLILVQVFASVIAGVYNEYLLKGCEAHFMMQNFFMYLDSIISNSVVLLYHGDLRLSFVFLWDQMKPIFLNPVVIAIVLNTTCIGICVSFFLKSLNSILKNFASAMELIFTAILSWILFGYPIDLYTFASIFVVTCAIVLYARNPVVNLPKDLIKAKHGNNELENV
ncbi:hypothetical protein LOTGIDRAFT_110799 [Lottia gigantea]|uniref:Sugar phosphate transporter domain-containing protein n=1 Tax=Lottia gigantea TaxID=225164 RepID=V4AYR4_LOTGI|nr:hypothetical protein LOTGIDRAFT_110799 [Lottia gigantea]ESP02803.1 hypothetical protein LOTGIDRAFT_110799 [Lottia gigantea]